MQFQIVGRFPILLRCMLNVEEADAAQSNLRWMGKSLRLDAWLPELGHECLAEVVRMFAERGISDASRIGNLRRSSSRRCSGP
jgi:hypothetical protein